MAVTVVSNPVLSPSLLSASYPAIIELSSDKYGTANITQFRYVAEVTALSVIGTKYTVPIDGVSSAGFFDVHELFKTILRLGHLKWGTISDITKMTTPGPQSEYVSRGFSVRVKEQYYDTGVFTENTGSLLNFIALRGWTDSVTQLWNYQNWYQLNGLRNFMPFSGLQRIIYPHRTNDPSWNPDTTHEYLNIKLTYYNTVGSPLGAFDNWFDRTESNFSRCVYFPLYKSGVSTHSTFSYIKVEIYTGTGVGVGAVLEETFYIDKNVETCVDDEQVVMFQDRLFQWAFMSFDKKQFTTINTRPQTAETGDGRIRYNVKSDDTVTLNTNWLADEQNDLIKDLVATEQCFLVDASDGSLEPVTVVPNSLRLQTSRNDGLHQYRISFRKSIDNFAP